MTCKTDFQKHILKRLWEARQLVEKLQDSQAFTNPRQVGKSSIQKTMSGVKLYVQSSVEDSHKNFTLL